MNALYHYNTKSYDALKTLERQGIDSGIKSNTIPALNPSSLGTYSQHISFFLVPIDTDKIGKIYGKDHKVWYPGNVLNEHCVYLDKLKNFKYEFVETPEKTKLYYDDSIGIAQYHKLLKEINLEKRYIGDNLEDFKKAYYSLLPTIELAYSRVNSLPNWNDIRGKYAATIPHVMIYPQSGEIKVSKTKTVRIA